MPQSSIYEQAKLPDSIKWQALTYMRARWPYAFEGERRYLTETYPSECAPLHFVRSEGQVLLSYVAIVRIQIEHAGMTHSVYGLGNMFTLPPYRGEGHARNLLMLATQTILESKTDLGILYCSQKMETFYLTAGWQKALSSTRIGRPEKYEESDEGRMMLFVSERGRAGQKALSEMPVYVDWKW
jgi:GNAT superfamily N-acetyltransferase